MTTKPSVIDSVRALTEPIGDVGGMWMLHPEVLGPCRDAGYPNGYAYYIAGRGGVLGDVDADVVTSAFGFFDPALVRKMWESGIAVEGARAAGARYAAACAQFGRTRLQGFGAAGRLAELAGKVADGVDCTGLALFAAWRAEPRPDDAEARAFLLMHVLRELRGSVHIVAVVASGLAVRLARALPGGAAHRQGRSGSAHRHGARRPVRSRARCRRGCRTGVAGDVVACTGGWPLSTAAGS